MIKEKWFTLGRGLAGTYQGLARRVPGFIDPRKRGLLYSVRRWTREEVIPHLSNDDRL